MDSHRGVVCLLIGHDCLTWRPLIAVGSLCTCLLEISAQMTWRRQQDCMIVTGLSECVCVLEMVGRCLVGGDVGVLSFECTCV